jgi:hypothetical protein
LRPPFFNVRRQRCVFPLRFSALGRAAKNRRGFF